MMFGLPFATFRLTILSLALLAQIYLFVRARRAIRSSRRSDRFKSRAVGVAGRRSACSLWRTSTSCSDLSPGRTRRRRCRSSSSIPPVVWNLGSLFSALLLVLGQIAGFLVRWAVQLARLLTRLPAPAPVNPDRRLLLQAGTGGLFAVPLLLSGYGASYVGRRGDVRGSPCLSAAPSGWFSLPTSMPASS